MLSFEWDALRPGDRVFVHDDAATDGSVLDGVVTMVDQLRGRGTNDVGVRLRGADGVDVVRRPRRLATHLPPMAVDPSCLGCARSGVVAR